MKNFRSIFLLFLFFCIYKSYSQNTVTYSNLSQTISANSGTEVSVSVLASCYGSSPNSILINPTYCAWDSGLTSISFSNGTYLLPGQNSTLTFKFKKTVSTNQSMTYKFSTNSSCFQAESQMIKITVNYLSSPTPSCSLSPPQNLSVSNITANSVNLSWNHVQGASYYTIFYKESNSTLPPSGVDGGCCLGSIKSLKPNTNYQFSVYPICSNGLSGYPSYQSATTLSICPTGFPTNLSAIPYNGGWTINFTLDPNSSTNTYTLEYVNLVNNNGGIAPITYSSTPDYSKNFFNALSSNTSFKFRFLQNCGMNTDWVFIYVDCPTAPTGLFVYSNGGKGTFNWDLVANSQSYKGEYLIYNLQGQQVSGTFISSSNNYVVSINTNSIPGDKFIKFRMRTLCSNGSWSNAGGWSSTSIWNN